MNDLTYNGRPCKNCGGTLRYKSSRGCLRCVNESPERDARAALRQATADARNSAILSGAPRYNGRPCKHCGNIERFTANSGCVKCVSDKATAYAINKRSRYISLTNHLMLCAEPPAPLTAHLYAMCPDIPQGHTVRYTTKPAPGGKRKFTGRDVLERMSTELDHAVTGSKYATPGDVKLAILLRPAYQHAMRQANLSSYKRRTVSREVTLAQHFTPDYIVTVYGPGYPVRVSGARAEWCNAITGDWVVDLDISASPEDAFNMLRGIAEANAWMQFWDGSNVTRRPDNPASPRYNHVTGAAQVVRLKARQHDAITNYIRDAAHK